MSIDVSFAGLAGKLGVLYWVMKDVTSQEVPEFYCHKCMLIYKIAFKLWLYWFIFFSAR